MPKRSKVPDAAARVRDAFLDAVGEKIKAARARAGLTQKELAEAVGTGQSWVYAIEDGQQNLQLGSLRRLAQVLGTTVRDLMPDETGTGVAPDAVEQAGETADKAIEQAGEVLRALYKIQALTRPRAPAHVPVREPPKTRRNG